jgi:hypothetical protein
MLTLDQIAEFTWGFNSHFLLKTAEGSFIWSDPDYCGDNTIVPFEGGYKEWLIFEGIPFGRDKGTHIIREYCGEEVKIKQRA